MAPTFTLRTVSDAGTLDKFLPSVYSMDMSPVFSKVGVVTFQYPRGGVNFNLLVEDAELAVVMNGVEIGELRCIVEEIEGNDADEAEDGALWKFTCRTMLSLFDRAVVYPQSWPVTNPPSQSYTKSTIGTILLNLISRAKARGALTEITTNFTGTVDSAGVAWGVLYDLTYDAGTPYSSLIDNMVDQEMVELRMVGRQLQAYRPGTLGSDKSTGTTPLRFQRGRDISESPRKTSSRELATTLLMAGASGIFSESVSDSATLTRWGRRESYSSVDNASDKATVSYLGSQLILTKNRQVMEVTHKLLFEDPANPKPVTNFNVGDWGLTDVGRGWEKYRIKQWVISVDNDGVVSGSVTLNDLIAEQLAKLNSKFTKLVNGFATAGASEEKDDGKLPAKPGSVNLSTDYYLDNSVARAAVTVSWSAVTTNADGSEMSDLEGYKVRWKYSTESAWHANLVMDSNELSVVIPNVRTDQQVQVQVTAYDRYNHGSGWTPTATITTAKDTIAPAKPKPPVVTSSVGLLRVSWDGLDYQDQPQVADYSGVEVHVGPNGTFTPTTATRRDFLNARSATATSLTGLTYGTEYWVRLVAVDSSGNKSAPSDETSTSHAILKPVVNVEIGSGQIGLDNIRFSDVGNLVDDGSFENVEARVARQAQMSGTHFVWDNTTSSNGTWSLKTTGASTWSDEELILQANLPVKPGERIFGAVDYRITADLASGAYAGLIIRWYDKDGGLLTSSGTPGTPFSAWGPLTSNTDGKVLPNNTWQTRITNVSQVAPSNAYSFTLSILVRWFYAGTIWLDGVEARRQIDTLLVADAAIGRAQIADLAVNNAKIADLAVGKLTTGTLAADIVLGARIKTANSGARAELNSGGLGLWNTANEQTLYTNVATGEIRVKGQIISAFAGKRVELNPQNSGLPEIRFYPTIGSNFAFINAVDIPGGDSVIGIGVNSGQFTDSDTGVLSSYRLYLSPEGGGNFETVRADTQGAFGGQVRIFPNSLLATVQVANRQHGYMNIFKDGASGSGGVGAQIGFRASSASNESEALFYQNGDVVFRGRLRNNLNVAPLQSQAMFGGTIRWTSSVGGFTWNWGVTSYDHWFPQVQIRDQQANYASTDVLTLTSFTAIYGVPTVGLSDADVWAWRMDA